MVTMQYVLLPSNSILTVVSWALICSKAFDALKLLLQPLLRLPLLPWLPLRWSDTWTKLYLRGFPSGLSQAKDTTTFEAASISMPCHIWSKVANEARNLPFPPPLSHTLLHWFKRNLQIKITKRHYVLPIRLARCKCLINNVRKVMEKQTLRWNVNRYNPLGGQFSPIYHNLQCPYHLMEQIYS